MSLMRFKPRKANLFLNAEQVDRCLRRDWYSDVTILPIKWAELEAPDKHASRARGARPTGVSTTHTMLTGRAADHGTARKCVFDVASASLTLHLTRSRFFRYSVTNGADDAG